MHNIKTDLIYVHRNALIGKNLISLSTKVVVLVLVNLTGKGHEKCGCSYGSVTVDPDTHRVNSNACNGPDRFGNSVCCTRVAPP
ncbi:unnamed protein product, partial [Rotaria magnacalcarata]